MASAEMSDSDASFEVDKILNQRKRKGVLEYLVRWKEFGNTGDSWEPAKNLSNCTAALAEYMKAISAAKTPKKSGRSKSRSKSRSRSRSSSRSRTTKSKKSPSRTSRGRSRTPRARSKTPRSRSRSSSRGRSTAVKDSPSRQSRRTETITKSSTNKEPGRVEKRTEMIRQTTEDTKPTETRTTRVVRSRSEIKTVEDKVDGKPVAAMTESTVTDKLYTLWQSADMAALILFVCVAVIALSYVIENQYSSSDLWKTIVGLFTAIVASVTRFFQMITTASGRAWETTANFTRESWKKVTH